jgi:filamentous hemagglutinin family protein
MKGLSCIAASGLRVLTLALLASSALAPPIGARAEVATDGRLGPRVRFPSGDAVIPANVGQRRGGNLFHSFDTFNIERGGRVTFTGPVSVKNVISRVTGGKGSRIDGTLASDIPNADVYLINPAGIVFGRYAQIDVKGSFHASTAEQLNFADGAVFSALDPAGSTLTVAAPESFGFLGAPHGSIRIEDSVLEVAPGKALTLSAAAIDASYGFLLAPQGRIALTAHGAQSSVNVITGTTSGSTDGPIRLVNGTFAQTAGDGGGTIQLAGGDIVLDGGEYGGSALLAVNRGKTNATGGVFIDAGGDLTIAGDSLISSGTLTEGTAGEIDIAARSIRLLGGSDVGNFTFYDPDGSSIDSTGGKVTIRANALDIAEGSFISSDTFGRLQGGSVDVRITGSLTIDGGGVATGISASSQETASGSGGLVSVIADSLVLSNGGQIAAATFGDGRGGSVYVRSPSIFAVGDGKLPQNEDDSVFTGISSQSQGSGKGGVVTVDAQGGGIELRRAAGITSSAFGEGDAGEVQVVAGRILIDSSDSQAFTGIQNRAQPGASGAGGPITVRADLIQLQNEGAISNSTFSAKPAGDLTVDAGRIEIVGNNRSDYTYIGSQPRQGAPGIAGSVTVNAESIELRDRGAIATNTEGAGNAGTIAVIADTIDLANNGAITSSTLVADGDAGDIRVDARQRLTLVGGRIVTNSTTGGAAGSVVVESPVITVVGGTISSTAAGTGEAGTVEVSTLSGTMSRPVALQPEAMHTGSLAMSLGGRITTSTAGPANAGQVKVRTGDLSISDAATQIASSSSGSGNAGAVRLEVGRAMTLDEATVESRSTGAGAGGDVTILARSADVTLKGSGVIAASAEGGKAAGNVVVRVGNLNAKDGVISTSGKDAAGGRITVAARERIYLRDTEVTSSGALPDPETGASVISLTAGEIILSRSQVESLTGDSLTLAGSGEASLIGEITVISADSIVSASSSVQISGLQTNLGSDLQISPSVFLDTNSLLQPSCADRGAARSTFTRSGRGGLPVAPDRPLPSAGADAAGVGRVAAGGTVFLDTCAGSLVPETNS